MVDAAHAVPLTTNLRRAPVLDIMSLTAAGTATSRRVRSAIRTPSPRANLMWNNARLFD
jgi:hypothetical protein